MSSKSNRKPGGGKKQTKHFGDVTLNDYANSTVCKYRAKKSANNVVRVLKTLEDETATSWDEKMDEFEGDFVQTENEDGTVSYVLQKKSDKKRTYSKNAPNETGRDYPLDIWYLISEYVRPEDVGRFAGICKSSFAVVCSAKFWFTLYKRYYKTVPNVPERLQPECMSRLYGARTSVIRALYYMYPPFVERLRSVTTFEKHPDCLRRRQCVLMWHQKQNKQWNYYFKLKENDAEVFLPRSQKSTRKPDLIEMLEDVSANPDDNCRILQATCKHFIAVPLVQGFILTSVALNLSQGLRHHRLQLGFGSGVSYSYQRLDGVNIVLDPVINVKVLDWWHPLYPHSHNIELLCNVD